MKINNKFLRKFYTVQVFWNESRKYVSTYICESIISVIKK
jgi:hypothetical protein